MNPDIPDNQEGTLSHKTLLISLAVLVVVLFAIAAGVYFGVFQKQNKATLSLIPKSDPFLSLPSINAYTQTNFGFTFKDKSSEYPSLALICNDKAPKNPTETALGQYTYCQNDGRPLKVSLAWKKADTKPNDYLNRIANTVMKDKKRGTGNFLCVQDKNFTAQNALTGILSDCTITASDGSSYYYSAYFFSPSLHPEMSQVIYAYAGSGTLNLNESMIRGMVRTLAKGLVYESIKKTASIAPPLLLELSGTRIAYADDTGDGGASGSCDGGGGSSDCSGDTGSTGDGAGDFVDSTINEDPSSGTSPGSPSCIASPVNPIVGDTVTWSLDTWTLDADGYTFLNYLNMGFSVTNSYFGPDPVYRNNPDYGPWAPYPANQTSTTMTYASPGTQYAALVSYWGSLFIFEQDCSVSVASATTCTSAQNSCGLTANGTIVGGVCNAVTPPESSCTSSVTTSLSVSPPGATADGSTSITIPYNTSADLHWNSTGIAGVGCQISDDRNMFNAPASANSSGITNTGPVTRNTTYYFYCYINQNGDTSIPKTVYVATLINGACGTASGTYSATQPTSNQCSLGTFGGVLPLPVCSTSFYGYPDACTAGTGSLWDCPSGSVYNEDLGTYETTYSSCTTDSSQAGWGWYCLGSNGGVTSPQCFAFSSNSTAPDLTASLVTPASATVGVKTPFYTTITNKGNVSTGGTFWNLFQSATNPADESTVKDIVRISRDAPLLPGDANAMIIYMDYTFTTPGSLYFRACADKSSKSDVNGVIAEPQPSPNGEFNNCSSDWTKVVASAASCSVTPSSGNVGDPFTWSVTGITGDTYTWSGTDGLSGSTASVTKTYSTSGTKTGSVVVTSGANSQTLTCTNSLGGGGITVNPPPTASLLVNGVTEATINSGDSATLTWSSGGNALSCGSADFSTGNVALNSTGISISPSATRSYTLVCYSGLNLSGVASAPSSVLVTVLQPQATILANPTRVARSGDSSTISWTSTDATSCAVTKNGTTVPGWTQLNTTPPHHTDSITTQSTYVLTCQTPTGTKTSSVIVNVGASFQEF